MPTLMHPMISDGARSAKTTTAIVATMGDSIVEPPTDTYTVLCYHQKGKGANTLPSYDFVGANLLYSTLFRSILFSILKIQLAQVVRERRERERKKFIGTPRLEISSLTGFETIQGLFVSDFTVSRRWYYSCRQMFDFQMTCSLNSNCDHQPIE